MSNQTPETNYLNATAIGAVPSNYLTNLQLPANYVRIKPEQAITEEALAKRHFIYTEIDNDFTGNNMVAMYTMKIGKGLILHYTAVEKGVICLSKKGTRSAMICIKDLHTLDTFINFFRS